MIEFILGEISLMHMRSRQRLRFHAHAVVEIAKRTPRCVRQLAKKVGREK